ncbi:MAG: hypothetical protein Q7R87_01100 [Nanoarchaeota archaeon]|nr:hypothetical protein [Nanoarchaeota archaeon]
MKGLLIRQLDPVNLPDRRGAIYEWCKGDGTRQITICSRNPNIVSGNHYHMGIDPSKNPERVLILSGAVRIVACNGLENIDKIVEGEFSEISISPLIVHSYISLDKKLILIEQRKTVYETFNSDTFHAESFLDYLNMSGKKVSTKAINKYMKTVESFLR